MSSIVWYTTRLATRSVVPRASGSGGFVEKRGGVEQRIVDLWSIWRADPDRLSCGERGSCPSQVAETDVELCQVCERERRGSGRRIGEAGEAFGEQVASEFVVTARVGLARRVVDDAGQAGRGVPVGLLFGVAEGGDA